MVLRFFDRDHAVLADLLHRVGDDVADGLIAVGRNGADLRDHLAGNRLRELLHFFDGHFDGLLDAALQRHRVRAGRNGLHAFAEDRLRQNGGGGGAVAGHVGGLRRHFAHHLRAHVLERILQLDFLGHRDAVLGDVRSAELLLQDHVAALGAEGDLHRVGQLVDAAQNRLTGIFGIYNLFCHCCLFSFCLAGLLGRLGLRVENAEDLVLTHDQELFAIQLDVAAGVLAEQDAVAHLHVERDHFAVFQALAFADGHHFALLGLLFGRVGDVQAALHLLLSLQSV